MLTPRRFLRLLAQAGKAWNDDYAFSMSAALAYYSVFSLAPLLVIVTAVAGALFGREAVQGQIARELSDLIGMQGARMVQELVASASDTDSGRIAGTVSVVVLLVGATTVFAELQSSLDRIWRVPERDKPSGLWGIVRARLLSFGLIIGVAFLLMVSLLVSAALAAIGTWAGEMLPGWERVLWFINIAISLATFTVLFAMIYKLLPSTAIRWPDVWVGSFVTAVLFEIGELGIGLYLGRSGITEYFQAAGAVMVLLLWVYYAALIFIFGAEFTKAYAEGHGSRAPELRRARRAAHRAQKLETNSAHRRAGVANPPADSQTQRRTERR